MMEQIITALEGHLTPLAKQINGSVFPSQDPNEVESKFGQSPAGGWSLIMCWEGFGPFDDQPIPNSGLQWARFVFVVESNGGMPMKKGKAIATFSGLVETVIGWLRAVNLQDPQGNTDTHGMELVDSAWIPADKPWRRHRLIMRVPMGLEEPDKVIVPFGA